MPRYECAVTADWIERPDGFNDPLTSMDAENQFKFRWSRDLLGIEEFDKDDLCLPAKEIGWSHEAASNLKWFQRKHETSGWIIKGCVRRAWFLMWIVNVEDFEAEHPLHGMIKGNFHCTVFATSPEAFEHFKKHHLAIPYMADP